MRACVCTRRTPRAGGRLLDTHPAVRTVHYPGLESHPGHALAARQQDGFGAMLRVEIEGGEPAVRAFLDGLAVLHPGRVAGRRGKPRRASGDDDSRGDVPEAREAAGIGDGLLRLSVGIEHVDDLLADIEAALARAEHAVIAVERAKR